MLPGIGVALGAAASGALSEATNKFLAENPEFQRFVKEMTDQIGKASETLVKEVGPVLAKRLQDGVQGAVGDITKKLGDKYGVPPDFSKIARDASGASTALDVALVAAHAQVLVREDNAAAAYDQLARTNYQGTTRMGPHYGRRRPRASSQSSPSGCSKRKQERTNECLQKDPRSMIVQEATARRNIAVTNLVNPPERVRWVRFYLNKERFTKTLAKTPAVAGVSGQPTFGQDPGSNGFQSPGRYMLEFESQQTLNPQWVMMMFSKNGVYATGVRELCAIQRNEPLRRTTLPLFVRLPSPPPPAEHSRAKMADLSQNFMNPGSAGVFIRTTRPFQLRNFPGLRWVISRKLL